MNRSHVADMSSNALLLERLSALQEDYLLLFEQYTGWRQSDLPTEIRIFLFRRTRQDIQHFRKRLSLYRQDASLTSGK